MRDALHTFGVVRLIDIIRHRTHDTVNGIKGLFIITHIIGRFIVRIKQGGF